MFFICSRLSIGFFEKNRGRLTSALNAYPAPNAAVRLLRKRRVSLCDKIPLRDKTKNLTIQA